MSALVQPFISTVTGTLDSKGRVCIPAPFRHLLAAQSTEGVLICPSFFEPALEAFGATVLATFNHRLASLDPFFSSSHDDQAYAVLAATQQLPLDEQGRVRLPDAMIEHAGLAGGVVFVGMGQKFQIWNPEKLAPIQAQRLERARAARDGGA